MDRFELDGKTYVAKDEISRCEGCGLAGMFNPSCAEMEPFPSCQASARADEREIIWVEESE